MRDCAYIGNEKDSCVQFFRAYDEPERVVEACNRMAEVAIANDAVLCHENEKEVYGDTAIRVRELMLKLQGWKFVYDPANFVQTGQFAEETLSLASQCDYYHIKDALAKTGELVPAGEGDGAVKCLVAGIRGDKTLTIEPHLALFEGYDEIDGSEMKHRRVYRTRGEAFDVAVNSLKAILKDVGYRETDGIWERLK